MGVSQTKRTQAVDTTVTANATTEFVISTSEDPCNIHGLIVDVHIGNTSAGLNFGQWGVFLLPRKDTSSPGIQTSAVNSEEASAVTWMLGNWMNVLETVDHIGGAPKSSRNCPRQGRLVFKLENSPVSVGTVRVHGTFTWFETTM